MRHKKGHLDVKQEEHSKDPSSLCQKQNSEADIHAVILDEVSSAIKHELYDLQQRQNSDSAHDVSKTHEEESSLSCKNEKNMDSNVAMQKPTSSPGDPAQESNPPPVSCLVRDSSRTSKDESADVEFRQSPDSGVKTSATCDGSSVKTLEKLQPRRNPDGGGCSSQSGQAIIPSSVCEKLSTGLKEETQPGQENCIYSTKFEKVEKLQPRRNPDPVVQESHSGGESTPSKVPDKGLYDGYNWRKYGQKLVKGNKFVRSYYKCTFLNCQAKKQVERAHDGFKTDVNYLGNHYHEKPQPSPLTSAPQESMVEIAIVSASNTNDEPSIDHGGANQLVGPTETLPQSAVARSGDGVTGSVSLPSNDNNEHKDDHPDPKRQKRETTCADDLVVNTSNSDLRHVVQTMSEVDLVNDGYRWRKYGQKLVKGNPNPRSYYRCSYAGCPVKKHVERASHDSKVVITTYEGKHDHDVPTSRTVNQSVARADASMMTSNGESSSKPEENTPVSHEMAVHV